VAGAFNDRYETKYIEVDNDSKRVTARLLVHQTSPEDLVNYCYLEAVNELGRAEYQFKLVPKPKPTVDPNSLLVSYQRGKNMNCNYDYLKKVTN